MTAVIRHLHALVKEVRLTQEEWMAAIQFLTKTGQMCSDWRQEFILLSDTLGVSMLVDTINHSHSGATENTVLGPFYVANPPHYENGHNICLDGKGEPMVVRGRVTDTSGEPIAGATVDAWQTNEDGFYDVQQKGVQPEMNLRGVFTTNDRGRVLVSLRQTALVSDSRRRPGRRDARSDGPRQYPPRAYPLHRPRGWLRRRRDPRFPAGLSLPRYGRRVRRQGKPDWRLPTERGQSGSRPPRFYGAVLDPQLGFALAKTR